jgi:hypothetical protein
VDLSNAEVGEGSPHDRCAQHRPHFIAPARADAIVRRASRTHEHYFSHFYLSTSFVAGKLLGPLFIRTQPFQAAALPAGEGCAANGGHRTLKPWSRHLIARIRSNPTRPTAACKRLGWPLPGGHRHRASPTPLAMSNLVNPMRRWLRTVWQPMPRTPAIWAFDGMRLAG